MIHVTTAERWIAIMQDLSQMRFATMSYFAEKYNVSRRTIQRDMYSILRLMPLEIKRGRNNGGIYVMGNYSMDNTYMTKEQIELLIKIKEMVSKELTYEENVKFDYIITSYTKPSSMIVKK